MLSVDTLSVIMLSVVVLRRELRQCEYLLKGECLTPLVDTLSSLLFSFSLGTHFFEGTRLVYVEPKETSKTKNRLRQHKKRNIASINRKPFKDKDGLNQKTGRCFKKPFFRETEIS